MDPDDLPFPEPADFKVGERFRYTVSPEGDVSDVEGAKEFVARIVAAFDKTQIEAAPDPAVAQMMRGVRETFESATSSEAQADMFGESYGTLPTTALAPGENWTYDSGLDMMLGVARKRVFTSTFAGREGDLALVNESAVLSSTGDAPVDLGALGVTVPPGEVAPILKFADSGSVQGQMKIDEKTGIVRFYHSLSQKQSITTTIDTGEQGGKSEEVTDTVDETTSTTEILPLETIVVLPAAAAPAV